MKRSGNLFWVTPDEVVVAENFNVRIDYGDLEELMNSIIENGIKVNLKGRLKDGKFILTDGHRRYKAVCMAYERGYTDIMLPILREANISEEDRVLGLILYNSGKPLTMLEEAEVYRRLRAWNWTTQAISKRVGKSASHVDNCLLLLTAPPEVKQKIESNEVAATTVVNVMRTKDKEVAERNMAVIEKSEGKVTNANLEKPKKKLSTKIAQLFLLADDLDIKNTADYSNILRKIGEYLSDDSIDLNDLKDSLLFF